MTAILSMRIAVRTFAAYRQAIGQGAFTLDLPAGTTPGLAGRRRRRGGGEKAGLPPRVSGGDSVSDAGAEAGSVTAEIRVGLAREPIDAAALVASVGDRGAGGG